MAVTKLNAAAQVLDGSVTRAKLNTTLAASAVIAKVIAGTGISLAFTGVDSGTGDVTVSAGGGQTLVNNVDYAMLTTNFSIQYNTTVTQNRTVSLVAASAVPAGRRITIGDQAGSLSNIHNIIVARAGTDLIVSASGTASSHLLGHPYAQLTLESNGSNTWTVLNSTIAQGYISTSMLGTANAVLAPQIAAAAATLVVQPRSTASTAALEVNVPTGGAAGTINVSVVDTTSGNTLGTIGFKGKGATVYKTAAYLTAKAAETFSDTLSATTLSASTVNLAEAEAVRWLIDGNGAFNIGAASGSPSFGDCNIAGAYKVNGVDILANRLLNYAGSQTADVVLASSTTYTTGGTTLANQTLAAGSVWRIRAYGTITSVSSATARTAQFKVQWGNTGALVFQATVAPSVAGTAIPWTLECELNASSTTVAWLTGIWWNTISTMVISPIVPRVIGSTSVTLPSGAQTLDFMARFSTVVAGDSITVVNVTMERLA